MILEIETVGAMKIKAKIPEAVMIFVLPPSLSELKSRLTSRGTESADVIKKRTDEAVREIEQSVKYDYIIINDKIEEAVEDFRTIVNSQRLKTNNNKNTISEVLKK